MSDSKVSDLSTRTPQATDLLMLGVTDSASYKTGVSAMSNVFYPEWYDNIGVTAGRDMAAIQAAVDAALLAGNMCVAGNQGYRNGVADGAAMAAGGPFNVAASIGCYNNGGVQASFCAVNVQAFAIYDITLTATQVAAMAAEMATL